MSKRVWVTAVAMSLVAMSCGEEAGDGPVKLSYTGGAGGGNVADAGGDRGTDVIHSDDANRSPTANDANGMTELGDGTGVGVGDGTGTELNDGTGTGVGNGDGVGVGNGDGVGVGNGDGVGIGDGNGDGVGVGIGDGNGVGVGDGVGVGIGDGNGDGVGDGTGTGSKDSGGAGSTKPDGTKAKPTLSCKHLKASHPATKSGLYWIKSSKNAAVVQTWCDFDRDGGGWTLVAVSADDDQDTWTWNNRAYWTTNAATFGSPTQLAKDFKSPLFHQVAMKDLLFAHGPSGVWAAYHGVGDGKLSLAQKLTQVGGPHCYKPGDGYALSAGKIGGGDMCDTRLYLSPMDKDGSDKCGDEEHAYGPAWNAGKADGCPFNDPGERGGLGPVGKPKDEEEDSVGFGKPMGLNKGGKGAQADRMLIFVR